MNETKIAPVNRMYKDRLFKLLFGENGNKENILSLYNALNGTDYKDTEGLTVTTLENVIFMSMKNDVSFLLESYLSLYEQQSTYNPNMPLRGLFYFSRQYESFVMTGKLNIFGKTLIKIPTPKYVVLYNGRNDYPAEMKIRLSDAFIKTDDSGEFEWTATMVNINTDKNPDLLSKCKPLSDYMELIDRIRRYQDQGDEIEEAVDKAVQDCITDGILKDFLIKHRTEVQDVCITEFNEEEYTKAVREEGKAEGRAEGKAEGRAEGQYLVARKMLAEGEPTIKIIRYTELSEEEIEKLKQENK